MLSTEKVNTIFNNFGVEYNNKKNVSTILINGKEVEITDDLSDKILSDLFYDETDINNYDNEIVKVFRDTVLIDSNAKELSVIIDVTRKVSLAA